MKRLLPVAMLTAFVLSSCKLLPERSSAPAVAPALNTPPASPVKPEEVTGANARMKARALQQEMDQELEEK